MRWTSISAIFWLFWALSFFFVLPFRLQRRGPDEPATPGQFAGSPTRFSFPRTCLWTTIVALVLFGLFYLNYIYDVVPVGAFNFVPDRVIEGR